MKISISFSILLITVLMISFQTVKGGDRKLKKQLIELGFNVAEEFVPFKNGEIRVVKTGNPEGVDLIFIHGSPGDWTAWKDIVIDSSLQSIYNITIVDRPGYGKTTTKALPTLKDQAKAIKSVVNKLQLNNAILVSHSYGGGVAEQLLIDYPSIWKYNVFISPTLSPKLQKVKWYNKVGRRIKFMIPKDLKSSNIEMYGLKESLKCNENDIKEIKTPITFLHGKKDWLVPIETVDYFKKYSNGDVKYIIEPKESHFILWTKPELIIDEIKRIGNSF